MKNFDKFDPQGLSNIVWSYATSGEAHPRLFSKVSDHTDAMKDLSTFLFLPQALSNIVWAYTTAGRMQLQVSLIQFSKSWQTWQPQSSTTLNRESYQISSGHMLLSD